MDFLLASLPALLAAPLGFDVQHVYAPSALTAVITVGLENTPFFYCLCVQLPWPAMLANILASTDIAWHGE